MTAGWMSLQKGVSRTAGELKIKKATLETVIEDLGLELPIYRSGTNVARAISPDALELIRKHPKITERAGHAGNLSLTQAAEQLGVALGTLRKIADDLDTELPEPKKRQETGAAVPIPSDIIEKLEQHPMFKIPPAEEDDLSIRAAAQTLGTTEYKVRKAMQERGWEPVKKRFRGVVGWTVSAEQLSILQRPEELEVFEPLP